MRKRKRVPKPSKSTLALGKICGCGSCRYCDALSRELTWQSMVEEVGRGKQIAGAHREEQLKKWSEQ
jgi:hypothetical protein